MTIDIYTGPFTRYFSGLWEKEVHQNTSQEKKKYHLARPISEGKADKPLDQIEISKITENWLSFLERSLDTVFILNEDDSVPYFTSRFNEYSNLYRASSYVLSPEIDLSIFKDQELRKNEEENQDFLFFRDVEAWFPVNLPGSGISEIYFPDDTKKIISTTHRLISELENVAERIVNKPLSELEENYYSLNEEDLYWTDNTGLLILYKHAQFSLEHNVPIILDY